MTTEELQTIGEYVVWLESHGNNLHQCFCFALIRNAPLWKAHNDEGPETHSDG